MARKLQAQLNVQDQLNLNEFFNLVSKHIERKYDRKYST